MWAIFWIVQVSPSSKFGHSNIAYSSDLEISQFIKLLSEMCQ